jgi:hypothetical protein
MIAKVKQSGTSPERSSVPHSCCSLACMEGSANTTFEVSVWVGSSPIPDCVSTPPPSPFILRKV